MNISEERQNIYIVNFICILFFVIHYHYHLNKQFMLTKIQQFSGVVTFNF